MALRVAWVVSHEVPLQFVVVGAEVRILSVVLSYESCDGINA